MTDRSEAERVFDGTCNLSKNGDITLTFDDGSSLVTHSFILTRASPIFKNMLEDCEHDGIIQLTNVSKDVWIEILRELYPGTHTFFLKLITGAYDESLEKVAVECYRYNIQGILHTLDEFMSWKIQKSISFFDPEYDSRLTPIIKLADTCRLEKSKQKIIEYITHVISKKEAGYRENYRNYQNVPPSPDVHKRVQEAVVIILNSNDTQWILQFCLGTLNNVLRMNLSSRGT